MTITIPGKPIPFARPRKGKHGWFNQPDYAAWKQTAALIARSTASCGGWKAAPVPHGVSIVIYGERPDKRPAHIELAEWKTGAACWRIGRSDLDNHAKAVLDALVDSGVLTDDRVVGTLEVVNRYAAANGFVGIVCGVWRLDGVAYILRATK